jgi:hypothetical protein
VIIQVIFVVASVMTAIAAYGFIALGVVNVGALFVFATSYPLGFSDPAGTADEP